MKVALVITYRRQGATWPAVSASVERQTVSPDELYLAIGESDGGAPRLGPLPWRIVRTPKEYDDGFAWGGLINRVLRVTDADVLIAVDGDCILAPTLVETYKAVFAREIKAWDVACSDGNTISVRPPKGKHLLLTGSRYFLKVPPKGCLSWEVLHRAIAWLNPRGNPGQPDGSCRVMPCNFGFPVTAGRAAELGECTKPVEERKRDLTTLVELCDVAPLPEEACVLHMGLQQSTGAYYGTARWKP